MLAESHRKLGLPEENLLYFVEKHAPKLEGWQRELVRIVRNISQYFYPQKQTKLMNEGCATFVHYEIMNRLHREGARHRRRDARVPAHRIRAWCSSRPSTTRATAASTPMRSASP